MVNAKAAFLLIVASVLLAVMARIAVTQFVSSQANANGYVAGQAPQGASGSYPVPQPVTILMRQNRWQWLRVWRYGHTFRFVNLL